jgi:Mg2+-importing ATPase
MVSNTATLVRDGKEAEISLKMLVPGDIIRLAGACKKSCVSLGK